MNKRIYYINGVEATLREVLDYLEHLLVYDGNLSIWADLGVNFEDKEINE